MDIILLPIEFRALAFEDFTAQVSATCEARVTLKIDTAEVVQAIAMTDHKFAHTLTVNVRVLRVAPASECLVDAGAYVNLCDQQCLD